MSERSAAWTAVDMLFKTAIAVAGLWGTFTYHKAQQRATEDKHDLDQLSVVKDFFPSLRTGRQNLWPFLVTAARNATRAEAR
jgi:hypothetical protein